MKINYIRFKNHKGDGCVFHDVELCCEKMKEALSNNIINTSQWNPYVYRNFYLGIVQNIDVTKRNVFKLDKCPFCGKPIIFNEIENKNDINIYDGDKDRHHDEFYTWSFNKGKLNWCWENN